MIFFLVIFLLRLNAETATTFYRDVLPILEKHCQMCHRPGEIAPFPLLSYGETRPWAKPIARAVERRKMPPWFADRCCGHFANDNSLHPSEIATLAAWAEAGAPEGNPKDAPKAPHWAEEWNIGKPDLVVKLPAP